MANKDIKSEDDLFQMKLHEVKAVNNSLYVTRVIGGWLYEAYYSDDETSSSSTSIVFVPEPNHSIIN